jgi:3-oxoacyl-[acyl-carrier protein] reductase
MQGSGRIVKIASLAGENGGSATSAHYVAAKGGAITFAKVFLRAISPRTA